MSVSRPRALMAAMALATIVGLRAGDADATVIDINFEGLAAGTIVAGQLTDGSTLPQDVYGAFDVSVVATNAANSLCIFDSANPTGNDADLGTPNKDFGGPGIGVGGEAGSPGENKVPRGKILIIPENLIDVNNDGLVDSPDDNDDGGVITFTFPSAGLLQQINFVDMEEVGATIDVFNGNQLVQSFPVPAFGDNSQVTVTTVTTVPVDKAIITLPSSGAITGLFFDPEGCIDPPCDVAGPATICAGNSATFTTTVDSSLPKQWSVNSTPGGICSIQGSSAADSVVVDFNAAGSCTVSLTTFNPDFPEDCNSTCSQIVTVTAPPACDITGPNNVCVGNTRQFSTAGDGLTNWSVSSTPGGICSIVGPSDSSVVSVAFSGLGVCTVDVTVSDPVAANCESSCTKLVTVVDQPACTITGPLNVCVGNTRTYTTAAPAGYSVLWSTGSTPANICAISGADNGSSVDILFTGAGQCTISVDVSDPADPENCRSQCTLLVTVADLPACSIEGPDRACVGNTRTFSTPVDAGLTKAWSASSTPANICNIPGATDGSTVDVAFTGAGVCTVSLTVSDPGDPQNCASTCTKLVTVVDQPACTITGPEAVCIGSTANYTSAGSELFNFQWSVASTPAGICSLTTGAVSKSVGVEFIGAGVCTISVTVTDGQDPENCASTCTKLVTVSEQPECTVSGPAAVCVGNTAGFTTAAGAGLTKQWSATSTPAGICSIVGATDGSSVQVSFSGTGECTVSVLVIDPNDPDKCRSTCSWIVSVNDQPDCTITGDDVACVGNTRTYTTAAASGLTKAWSIASTPTNICAISGPSDGSSIDVDFTGAGSCTISVLVSDPNDPDGCQSSCSKIVSISGQPDCTISGDAAICAGGSATYTTSAPAGFTKLWSVTSTPSGICAINGSNSGGSVDIDFTGAGFCTVSVTTTDPNDPENCRNTCSTTVTVNPVPTCSVSGPEELCAGEEYVFHVAGTPANATYLWNISGDASIVGSNTADSVTVSTPTPGSFLLAVTASSNDCHTRCVIERTVDDCTPVESSCWMTGGGCLNEGERSGQKNHTFGGNVGPPSASTWQHQVRHRNNIEFNFHSWDASVDRCWKDDGEGPCATQAEANNIEWSGTGLYSLGNGPKDVPATFQAYVQDRREGSCGSNDYYEITVFNLDGSVAFEASGEIDCGNMQIHKNNPNSNSSPQEFEAGTTGIEVQPAPNPFRTTTQIAYTVRVEGGSDVSVIVYDVTGRRIRSLVNEYRFPGAYEVPWDGRSDQGDTVAGGIYFIRVVAGSEHSVSRVMFVR